MNVFANYARYYDLLYRDKDYVGEIRETHRMRYLFKPELELLLSDTGFRIINYMEWMSGNPLDINTWGGVFIVDCF